MTEFPSDGKARGGQSSSVIQTPADDEPPRVFLVEDSEDDAVLLGRQLAAAGRVRSLTKIPSQSPV